LLGQATATSDWLLQSADLGGVWLLSFLCILAAAAVAVWFVPDLSKIYRSRYTVVTITVFMSAAFYGYWKWSSRGVGDDEMRTCVIVYPNKPTNDTKLSLATILEDRPVRDNVADVFVLFSETCTDWNSEPMSEGQATILALSRLPKMTVVAGVWLPGSNGSRRNACVIVSRGEVAAVIDKKHLVPFVESKPFGTNWFVKAGMIPAAATRDIAAGVAVDYAPWRLGELKILPSVCYDLFFSQSFRRFPQNLPSINVCCLDETFDLTGVFKQLSQVHSRLRAVELRQPIVRSSLGGVSGAFNRWGEPIQPQKQSNGFSIYEIPLGSVVTAYERFGDWFPLSCCLVCAIAVLVCLMPKRAQHGDSK
jgi:apolipoprotein N-acyltransferase